MKRFVVIILLLTISFQFAGIYCYLIFRLIEVRSEMHARISEHPLENLQKIVLTLTQYTAAKVTGDEIKIDNKMYDVAHLEYKGDTVIVYAQHDEDEDDLMAYFHSVLKRGHKDRKRVPGNLIKVLATQYLGSSFTIDFASPLSVQFDTAYLTYYSSLEFGKPTPPPRYC